MAQLFPPKSSPSAQAVSSDGPLTSA